MIDLETISVYDEQVDSYHKLITPERIDRALERFVDHLKPGDYVLDLGCGPATASSTMREKGLLVDPVDASDEMIKLANKTYDIGARKAYFHEIDAVSVYDGIWANFSLLHATQTEFIHALVALRKAIKRDGYFYLGMKTGEGNARDKLGRFYTYYSQDQLTDYLSDAGFKVIETEAGEGRGLAGNVEPWITMTSVATSQPER
ncbi:MAG: class I SAM-dependent methyltransferase [Granulosicoccus sp.]